MASIPEVKAFLAAIERLGITAPKSLADIPAIFDALVTAKGAYSRSASDLVRAYADGRLTVETAAQMLGEVARASAEVQAANDAILALDPPMSSDFCQRLLGDAGDELITSLRPLFDAAVAGIVSSSDVLPRGISAAAVLELDHPDAATTWRDLPKHVAVLDTIHSQIVQPLVNIFGCKAQRMFIDQREPVMAFIIDPSLGTNLLNAATEIGEHPGSYGREGRWGALLNAGFGLRLNTPREAIALTDAFDESRDDAERAYTASLVKQQRPYAERGSHPRREPGPNFLGHPTGVSR